MSILGKIKDQISRISKRALGIDAVGFNLQVTLETLARVDQDQGKLSQSAIPVNNPAIEIMRRERRGARCHS
jgi:hypothetical protein